MPDTLIHYFLNVTYIMLRLVSPQNQRAVCISTPHNPKVVSLNLTPTTNLEFTPGRRYPAFFLLDTRILMKRHLLELEPVPATGAGAVAGTASLISMAQRGKA